MDADADGRAPGQDDRRRDRAAGPVERGEIRVVLRRDRLAAEVGDSPGRLRTDVLVREHAEVRDRPRPQFVTVPSH